MIKMKKKIFVLCIIASCFILGCVREDIIKKCEKECLDFKRQNIDLSNGPCINNFIYKGWVCDVAHSPREDIDNLPENQCDAFRNGTAKHFVEVDTNCNFIRKY